MALQGSILQILAMLLAFQSRLLPLCKEYKLVVDSIFPLCIYFVQIHRDSLFVHISESN